MPDYTSPDESRAEVAMLSHEVYRLTQQLRDQEQRQIRESTPDKYDPFDNPTEYKGFGGDYSKILPRITEPAYEIPLEPDHTERRGLRKYYSIGSWCMILHFICTFAASSFLLRSILSLLVSQNSGADRSAIVTYIKTSSISASVNMLIYLVFNVLIAMLGMKLAGIKHTSVIRTNSFTLGRAVQYCLIAVFLWSISLYASIGLQDVFDKYGIDIAGSGGDVSRSLFGTVIFNIYTCVIAPITEELLFRGMLLRTFAKANQRFAIFATAFFFGISHGNIPQFVAASLMGIFLAHITLKHGSIIPAVIVHIFMNTASTVLFAVMDIGKEAYVIAFLCLIAAAMAGAVMLLVFRGTDGFPVTTPKQSKRGIYVAASSLPFLVAAVMNVLYIMYALMQNKK